MLSQYEQAVERIETRIAERARDRFLELAGGSPRDKFKPQEGPQMLARDADADIVIMGGAAFGGKTWSLLTDPLDEIETEGFRCAMFRRLTTALSMPGGLADESEKIYPKVGGIPKDRNHRWEFPSGARITMHHMQFLADARKWELGAQLARASFDQLEEFEEEMFWIIVGRMRTSTGIKPKIFGTCNPVPDDDPIGGWLNRLLAWWWDQETGYAIPERSGVKRWFYRVRDQILWYDSEEEAVEANPDLYEETTAKGERRINRPKSLCFIAAGIDDNPIGEQLNPEYRGSLNALTEVKRERMKQGNWKIRDEESTLFDVSVFHDRMIDPGDVPRQARVVRFWDKASTKRERDKVNPKHSATASVKMGVHVPGGDLPKQFYIWDATEEWVEMVERERIIDMKAEEDGKRVQIYVEQEGAGSGKDMGRITCGRLANKGFHARSIPPKGEDKLTRCQGFASDCAAGNVWVVRGDHAKVLFSALRRFTGKQPGSDVADAGAGAYNELAMRSGIKPWIG